VKTSIITKWEREREIDDALARISDLSGRAGVYLLKPHRVLVELRHPSGRWPISTLLERLAVLRLTTSLLTSMRKLAADLIEKSDSLPVAEQHHFNTVLRVILARLSKPQARALVQPFINHRLKERRELAFSVFRWAGVNRRIVKDILERHSRTGEERLLKIVVSAKGSGGVSDLLKLLPQFSDRYWKMRVLQAILKAGRQVPFEVVESHPTEFLQAIARS